jgi:hypothetical protein
MIPEGKIVIKLHLLFINTVAVNNNPDPSAVYLGIPGPILMMLASAILRVALFLTSYKNWSS